MDPILLFWIISLIVLAVCAVAIIMGRKIIKKVEDEYFEGRE